MIAKAANVSRTCERELGGLSAFAHLKSGAQLWMISLNVGGEVAASQSQVRTRFSGNLNMLLHIEKLHGRDASEIARAIGVAPQVLSRWRAGTQSPRDLQVDKLAEVLGVDVEVFYRRTGLSPDSSLKESLQQALEELGGRVVWSGKT